MLVIKIRNDSNDAFCHGNKEEETVRILREIIKDIEAGKTYGYCIDYNGNKVGEWKDE